MTENTQTLVDDANAPAEPNADAGNAADESFDLDQVLSEFETAEQAPTPVVDAPATDTKDTKTPAYSDQEVADLIHRERAREIQQNISDAAKVVGEGIDLPEGFIEGYIEQAARKDVRIRNAWLSKDLNPSGWQKVLKGMNSQIRSDIKAKTEAQKQEDERQMVSAMHSSATKAKHAPTNREQMAKINKMSDLELEQYLNSGGRMF